MNVNIYLGAVVVSVRDNGMRDGVVVGSWVLVVGLETLTPLFK